MNDEVFSVGDRVLYKAEINNPGHYAPGAMLAGIIVSAFPNPFRLSYRIRLDMVWKQDRVAAEGQNIVVGNVRANVIFRDERALVEDLKPKTDSLQLALVS